MKELTDLTAAIQTYFDAIHECDIVKLNSVFHPQSSLFDADNGAIFVEPIKSFSADVAERNSPHSAGQSLEARLTRPRVTRMSPLISGTLHLMAAKP